MKKYILCRFTLIPIPDPEVTAILREVTEQGVLVIMPGCIVTHFESEKSFEEINEKISQIEDVVYILSEDAICSFLPGTRSTQSGRRSAEDLEQALENAIKNQNFEAACHLRDVINSRKKS